jgi:hypothetical protein
MSDDEKPDLGTGIEGLEADSVYKQTPVFDVSNKEFFNNLRAERSRVRFTKSEKPNQFMRGTKYRQSFYIRYTDKNTDKQYLSKIK